MDGGDDIVNSNLGDPFQAEVMLQLVHERGYVRGKDLLAEFERYRKPVK